MIVLLCCCTPLPTSPLPSPPLPTSLLPSSLLPFAGAAVHRGGALPRPGHRLPSPFPPLVALARVVLLLGDRPGGRRAGRAGSRGCLLLVGAHFLRAGPLVSDPNHPDPPPPSFPLSPLLPSLPFPPPRPCRFSVYLSPLLPSPPLPSPSQQSYLLSLHSCRSRLHSPHASLSRHPTTSPPLPSPSLPFPSHPILCPS